MSVFEDIRILEVDKDLSTPAKGPFYDVYFRLSQSAPAEWSDAFDEYWNSTNYPMKRRAYCESNHIVLHCPPDEIEKYHKQTLLQGIAHANMMYREFCAADERRRRSNNTQVATVAEEFRSIADRLRFD